MIKECFEDVILQILIVATFVSLITGGIQDGLLGLVDGFSILIAIVIIVAVTVGNNLVKEKQF
jgi:P-type Ca2+ transporter type 2B